MEDNTFFLHQIKSPNWIVKCCSMLTIVGQVFNFTDTHLTSSSVGLRFHCYHELAEVMSVISDVIVMTTHRKIKWNDSWQSSLILKYKNVCPSVFNDTTWFQNEAQCWMKRRTYPFDKPIQVRVSIRKNRKMVHFFVQLVIHDDPSPQRAFTLLD